MYALIGVVASIAIPTDVLSGSSAPLLRIVEAAHVVPSVLFSAIALVAVANGALTGVMSSRLAYGMARDGLLPGVLTRLLPTRRTPWVAIVVTTTLSLLLALTGTIEVLASTMVLLLLVVFFAVNLAVLVLRRDHVAHEHFRVPSVLPIGGLLSCLLLVTQVERGVWTYGIPLLAVAGVLAWFAARNHGNRSHRR